MATPLPRRRHWSSLPELAVFEVATRLNPVDFLSLAGVCKPWPTICTQNKAQINAHHPPLLLCLNFFDRLRRKPCLRAYSFPDKRLYAKPLSRRLLFDVQTDHYLGFSHGYVLFTTLHSCRSGPTLCLFNPFTEHLVSMPSTTPYQVDQAVLTAPPSAPDTVVVALSLDYIMTCRPGVDDRWTVLPYTLQGESEFIDQAVFFKGRVHVLLVEEVVTIEIKPGISAEIIGVFCMADPADRLFNSRFCFVVGEDELFVLKVEVDKDGFKMSRVYRLEDHENGIWELVRDLGGRTLFASKYFGFVPSRA